MDYSCIQIQHLLKLNKKLKIRTKVIFLIQIQHLLKLNTCRMGKWYNACSIQIQHLLKLNLKHDVECYGYQINSNTTLVKVK